MSIDNIPETLLAQARGIRLAVFDVDGVMTDGRLHYSEAGVESKAFHSRDGLGLKGLMSQGIAVAVITARQSELVARRMKELGIDELIQGCRRKDQALAGLLERHQLNASQAAYTGDDLLDWPAMGQCGVKFAPADANGWIRERADWVTSLPGGQGAVREVCEFLLAAQGRLEAWQQQVACV
ncbi:MAG: KdsC family phosphatase [Wenzhouxiangella sp.]